MSRPAIAATDGAARRVELRGFQIALGQEAIHAIAPRVFEVEAQRCPAVELGVATNQVRLEQRHAAAAAHR